MVKHDWKPIGVAETLIQGDYTKEIDRTVYWWCPNCKSTTVTDVGDKPEEGECEV